MTYTDEYDEYDDFEDYEDEYDDRRALVRSGKGQGARRAVDWGVSGSIIAIIILTAIYAFSPIDFIPDVIPGAGQADDIAAILAGGGSVAFLTVARYILRAVVSSRVGRWGCLIVLALAAVGAFTVFYALFKLFDSVL